MKHLAGHPVNASTYRNWKCRCEGCKGAHADYVAEARRRRYAERVLIDGRLVHPRAVHGRPSSYQNYGCRCIPCTSASNRTKFLPPPTG